MKKIIITIHFFALTLLVNAQIAKVEITATGLTCSMCSNAINKQLKAIPEVNNIVIDLNKNLFTVTLKNNHNLTPKTLKDKVEKAGFFVGAMVLYINFNNQTLADNKPINNYIIIDPKPKTLNGITKLKVLDKGYITTKEYKKLTKTLNKYSTYATNNEDDYHLKTI